MEGYGGREDFRERRQLTREGHKSSDRKKRSGSDVFLIVRWGI